MKFESFDGYLQKQLQDSTFKAEYDRLGPEYEVIGLMIQARIEHGWTQAQLAAHLDMHQSAVARLESGTSNPTLATLQKVSAGLGKQLVIELR